MRPGDVRRDDILHVIGLLIGTLANHLSALHPGGECTAFSSDHCSACAAYWAAAVARLAGEGGTARERALDAALGFAVGAIADAIYTEDGLDGAAGERVLCLLAEAQQYGTHDARAVGRAEMLDLFGLACPDDDPGT